MKADVAQQRLLVDLASVDAELTRVAHRRANPPERQEHGELQAQQRTILDEVGALAIALEDLDEQVAKLDAEVTAVRQREDRDRSLPFRQYQREGTYRDTARTRHSGTSSVQLGRLGTGVDGAP